MLARALKIPANRAHYHLRRLIAAGLVREIGEAPKGRTEERLYGATARHVLIDPGWGGSEESSTTALRQSIEATFLDWRRAQVLAVDWGDLARLVVQRSLRIGPGDHLLVLFAPVALPAAEAILVEAEAAGAVAYPRPWSRNVMLRTLDRYSPEALDRLALVPPAVDERLTAAVLLTSGVVQGGPPNAEQRVLLPRLLRAVSNWKQSVPRRGLRYAHVDLPHRGQFELGFVTPEAGIDAFWRCATADLATLRERGERLMHLVQKEPDLVIQTGEGMELRVALDPSHASVSDGIISEDDLRAGRTTEEVPAGTFGALPAGGSGDGAFRADYAFVAGRHIPGVRVVLRGGRIVELDAEREAEVLREGLAKEAGEPGLLSGFTIGLNPGASGPTGKPEIDALLAGAVTLHFGNNELWGGTVRSTFNLSLPAHRASVGTRTATLVSGGRLVTERSQRSPKERR